MQRSSHGNADATASDHQTQSKSGSPRRVNFDLTPIDGQKGHQNATSPLISSQKGPQSIPYCDLATPLLSKRENGLDDSSRSSSPSHSRLRWAEVRSIARNSLATWETSRKGASSSTPRPASPQKSQSPGPKSPLKPCLKSPTSPTFAPQLPPPAPVPPPPRTPRRTAWRSQVAPSLPTLVEVSSAASGAKSDSVSRVSKSSKANQSNRDNRPRAATGRALRHEKYEMERKKRIREHGSKVSQTSSSSRSRPQGESPRSIKQEQGERVSRHEGNDSELSNTSKSNRNSRSSRVIKAKEANKKNPPRPPLTRRDAILEAMRVEDAPAPPLASSSVYSSSECSSPTIYSSSSIYSTDTATPTTSPATSTERTSPPSTPLWKRAAPTSPTSYTASGSDTESFPKTPQTPTSPTKTATSATVTEFDSEADTARAETVDTASSTHRTVSSVALGSALGLKRPSSAVRSVLGLVESQISAAQEPVVPEPESRRRRKTMEPRTEEMEKNREKENDGGRAIADLPKPKPQPRVRKRKQARFPETAEMPAKDLKETTSDAGERHIQPSIRGGADEQRPKRERKDGNRKREAQKAPASVDKENKTPEVGDGGVGEEVPRRHVSHHSIKSRRSVCVRGQGMNLFIDMAHAQPSTSCSSPTTTFASSASAPSTPRSQRQQHRSHHHRPPPHAAKPPAAADDDISSCLSTTTATSLHPGVDLARNPTNPKHLAFRNPFAPPPPPQRGMRYTRPVRRAYAWPRLDRGFDGAGRPPLDLGKALPPIPQDRGAESDCESDSGEDGYGGFGAAVGGRARTRPQSSKGRDREKDKKKPHPHPRPRRLSLSLSALPVTTPFLGALDVSKLAVGEERVFRLSPPPPPASTTTTTATRAAMEEAVVTASGLSRSFETGRGTKMRRHGSAPQPTTVKEVASSRGRGRYSCDDAAPSSSSSSRRPRPRPQRRSRPPPEPERPHSRTASRRRSDDVPASAVDQEVDGIARRLAFAIKNGRAKGTRAVKVSWAVGY